jgi:hypothetical protein
MTIILGAGMAGLLAAATQFQNAEIYEAQSKESLKKHTALLRFRSSAIGDALGIEFKKVIVHKAIWFGGKFHRPDPMLANMYSQKAIGAIQDRSIWNIETCERYIAPGDFHEQLIKRCESRINFDCNMSCENVFHEFGCPVISTLPMPILANIAGINKADLPEFTSSKIFVKRWKIKDCNTYQTIYFPTPGLPLYRASITGAILTAEYTCESEDDDDCIFEAFAIDTSKIQALDSQQQQLGKISPIDNNWRKQFMFDMSHNHQIYSLGRFATWRQILLDDVLKDISIIKKLINSSNYDSKMVASDDN